MENTTENGLSPGQEGCVSADPLRWSQICTALCMLGLMEDFSKGECMRVRKLLEKQLARRIQQVSRGLYQIAPPEAL